jgi:hypothetical protein
MNIAVAFLKMLCRVKFLLRKQANVLSSLLNSNSYWNIYSIVWRKQTEKTNIVFSFTGKQIFCLLSQILLHCFQLCEILTGIVLKDFQRVCHVLYFFICNEYSEFLDLLWLCCLSRFAVVVVAVVVCGLCKNIESFTHSIAIFPLFLCFVITLFLCYVITYL